MRLFVVTGFRGHWPVGTSALVFAESEETVALTLMEELAGHGLFELGSPEIREIDPQPRAECAIVLSTGEY